MKIYIKNMVCIRCESIVKSELERMGFPYKYIKSGEVEITKDLSPEERNLLNIALKKSGLGLLDDKKSVLVEKIKNAIIDLVHYTEDKIKVNLSDYLIEKLNYDYAYMAKLFSEVNGTTIEHFHISHRIERAKEMLIYEELSLMEIAEKLHFSSAAHLSNQFKKATGLTPSYFRQLKSNAS